jgi:hypothetical protein
VNRFLAVTLSSLLLLLSSTALAGHWRIIATAHGHDSVSKNCELIYTTNFGFNNDYYTTHSDTPVERDWPDLTSDVLVYNNDTALDYWVGASSRWTSTIHERPGAPLYSRSEGSLSLTLIWIPSGENDPVPPRIILDEQVTAELNMSVTYQSLGWTFDANCSAYATANGDLSGHGENATQFWAYSGGHQPNRTIVTKGRTQITLDDIYLKAGGAIANLSSDWNGIPPWGDNDYGIGTRIHYRIAVDIPPPTVLPKAVTNLAGNATIQSIQFVTDTIPAATAGQPYEAKIVVNPKSRVNLTWQYEGDPNSVNFIVRRTPTSPGFPKNVGHALQFTDLGDDNSGIDGSKQYQYTVTAENNAGPGPTSNALSIDPGAKPDELRWIAQRVDGNVVFDVINDSLDWQGQGLLKLKPIYAGNYALGVSVVAGPDTAPVVGAKTFNLTVNPTQDLAISSTDLPLAWPGENYSFDFQASGGIPPYTWYVVNGSLPLGLSLTPEGRLSGRTVEQAYATPDIIVQVRDSVGTQATQVLHNTVQPSRLLDDTPDAEIAYLDPWPFLNVAEVLDSEAGTGGGIGGGSGSPGLGYAQRNAERDPYVGGIGGTGLSGSHDVVCRCKIPISRLTPSGTRVSIAFKVLEDLRQGHGGMFPTSRYGDVAWLTHLGDPYVGNTNEPRFDVDVNVELPQDRALFLSSRNATWKASEMARLRQAGYQDGVNLFDLEDIRLNQRSVLKDIYTQRVWAQTQLPPTHPEYLPPARAQSLIDNFGKLNSLGQETKQARGQLDSTIFQWCANKTKNYLSKFGEIVVHESDLSKGGNGTIVIAGIKDKMAIRGGFQAVIDALVRAKALRSVPANVESAFRKTVANGSSEAVADSVRMVEVTEEGSRLLGVMKGVKVGFRIAGHVAGIAGIAMDIWDIWHAEDKVKAVIVAASGWAGAIAAASAAGTVMTVLEVAPGPGTVVHGIITFGAGVFGYFTARKITTYVYELFVHPIPPSVQLGYALPNSRR